MLGESYSRAYIVFIILLFLGYDDWGGGGTRGHRALAFKQPQHQNG